MSRGIIKGQDVRSGTRDRARELRQSMTPAEEWLWEALRGGRLDGLKFRRQQVIGGYIADFYCDAAGLVIEVDGPVHDTQAGLDQAREEAINLHGLRVLRFPNDRVLNQLPDVLAAIASTARTEGEHHDQHPQS
ncbi:MAG TPA: DUF559 domain-containing protein [Thermomicrobiales bacterium]|nr:restriction endonuclease [Chloroflexota bacterium]HQZ91121.1 DUF559 domain-containing protein [Thermomicrobiales bacterium]HRA30526.1 DUF559 domain-containing protein [Thermomicrobiales bacterium]